MKKFSLIRNFIESIVFRVSLYTMDNLLHVTDEIELRDDRDLESFPVPPQIPDHEDGINQNEDSLFVKIQNRLAFSKLTNFTEDEILSILRQIQPFSNDRRLGRGRKPVISWSDSILVLLMFYKTNLGIVELASFLSISYHLLLSAIRKGRLLLHQALTNKWYTNRTRPIPLNNSMFPYIGLCWDHTSIEIYKPAGRFNEVKRYYDFKNRIYALKKGFGILASSPNYMIFNSPSVPASIHDFEDFKQYHRNLLPYLLKTDHEKHQIQTDIGNPLWGVSMDRGYCANVEHTADIRRVTPFKGVRTVEEYKHNEEIMKVHVVERFFGRMKRLWKLTANVYKMELDFFDMDVENCALLTNEHIQKLSLNDEDYKYLKILELNSRTKNENRQMKRYEQKNIYMQKKKRRFNEVQ